MSINDNEIIIDGKGLYLKASVIPWDTNTFDSTIAQIEDIKILDPSYALKDYSEYQLWRDQHNCKIVSCRIPHDNLKESMLLEDKGFKFIEVIVRVSLEKNGFAKVPHTDQGLKIMLADHNDLEAIKEIAVSVFKSERFHVDPRINPQYGSIRYENWVGNVLNHPRQQLFKFLDGDELVSFFVIEPQSEQALYWHIAGVSSKYQGKGYGYRTYATMLQYNREVGMSSLDSRISIRNTTILNLLSKLNFKFLNPEMTFHWVRD